MSATQALTWNVGTCRLDVKGEASSRGTASARVTEPANQWLCKGSGGAVAILSKVSPKAPKWNPLFGDKKDAVLRTSSKIGGHLYYVVEFDGGGQKMSVEEAKFRVRCVR